MVEYTVAHFAKNQEQGFFGGNEIDVEPAPPSSSLRRMSTKRRQSSAGSVTATAAMSQRVIFFPQLPGFIAFYMYSSF
jgi:hypothetical protein